MESFRRIIRLFPRCAHIERAKATAAMLERMVGEDEKHPVLTPQQIAQLPPDERIAELIFRLRDQNGYQMSQPGWCDVFGYRDGGSAAHQLLEIGCPAAPALIEALTDECFSRSVGFHRDFHQKSTTALVNIMKTHTSLEVRLDAATCLLNRDHPEALPAVLHEWSGYHGTKDNIGSFDSAFETLADILACHGSERAVKALVEGWSARPPGQRLKIVEVIGSCMGEKPRDHSFDSNAKPRPPSAAARALAIELLVHALEDTETSYGITGGRAYGKESIGDFALYSLHQIDATNYTYSPKADRQQREAERIAAANLWRKGNGKPLPVTE